MTTDLQRPQDPSSLARFFDSPDRPDADRSSLATEQVEEMVAAWRRGERPRVEEYLARYPDLGDEAVLRLIYEEVCLRQEAGQAVDPAEVARRFPRWQAELEVLLDCHRLMEPPRGPDAFPEVGEVVSGFRLHAELGRGTSGRIFLASQPSLADRPMVLKITACGREEHLSLARLQHMNIVPLYAEQVLPARNLRVLCMPYLGGATLARLLEELADIPPARRTGRHLLEALDRVQAALPVALPTQGPFRRTFARASYVQAICGIGVCLADGLQYAHDRGLVHMDVKPSNVLVTGDGQPMLLDFHLAQEPIAPDGPRPSWLGGTPEYASPEQRAAMDALAAGRAFPCVVDGRSDLYSLGVLLYEALGGPKGGPAGASRPPLHRLNPIVSVGLSDIIHRCLRPDPRDRYPDAGELGADLRRHLNHQPLRGVANRSLLERWRKRRLRQPSALPRLLILLVLAMAGFGVAAFVSAAYRERVGEIEAALEDGRMHRDRHQYAEALRELRHGLDLARPLPAVDALTRELDVELQSVRREGKAAELHRLADLVRFRFGLAPRPSVEAWSLIRHGREIWEERTLLLQPVGGRHDAEAEGVIRTDLLDVVTVWADLRVRLAPAAEAAVARREALRWLDEAETRLGPSPALQRVRRTIVEALGEAGPSTPPIEPRSSWEHCDLGRAYLRSGQLAQAAEQFQLALDLRPQDFWPNFYQGLCAYQLEHYHDAVDAYRVCIALAPERAECYFNRGLAYEALEDTAQAVRDYSRALHLDGSLTEAAINRGLLYSEQGRYDAAVADLDYALATASGRKTLGMIHYNRALVELARKDQVAAREHLKAAQDLGYERARTLRDRLSP